MHDDVKMLQAQLREQTYRAISTETERVVYKFWEVVQIIQPPGQQILSQSIYTNELSAALMEVRRAI